MLLLVAAALLAAGVLLLVGVARAGRWRYPLGIGAIVLGLAVAAAAVALLTLGRVYRIPSESMARTLVPGDRIFVLRGDAGLGDVTVFHPPEGALDARCGAPVRENELCPRPAGGRADVTFVQRVVGVGGDKIRIAGGRVERNGRPLDEPYARPCSGAGTGCDFEAPVTVPAGHLYLVGDNRGASDDSRFYGPVPEDWVVGPVVTRYWPPSRLGAP